MSPVVSGAVSTAVVIQVIRPDLRVGFFGSGIPFIASAGLFLLNLAACIFLLVRLQIAIWCAFNSQLK
jgi:hypothetical protein